MARILAIDDDAGILYTLKAVAGLAGWELTGFQDPRDGIRAYSTGSFDLVMVDYHMPGMDGVLAVRELRRIASHTPIVVLTVDDRLELAERFREAGASDFAVKPVKAPDLISRLRLHLEGRPAEKVPELPKSMSGQTLDMVFRFVRESTGPVSIEDVAGHLGLAYQTTSRYLEYLATLGKVEVSLQYLQRGRPRKLYLKKPGQ